MKPFVKQRLAIAVLLAAAAGGVAAQETTSAIRGKILSPSGSPMANTPIVVIDTRTGAKRTFTTNSSGSFYAPKLSVGGPYTIVINNDQTVEVESISLGDIYNLTYDYEETGTIEEVYVIADAGVAESLTSGPSSSFGLYELENSVSIDRDIKNVIATDPRINLDANGGVNCAGKHPRFNSTTLDGVSQNDGFGLNDNGYATATGMPFPYGAIEQVSVELAPYDVAYGGFSACTINAVTKSGTNEFHGGVFYQYSDNSLKGSSLDTIDGTSKFNEDYDKFRRGFDFGGPIIEDKLFFQVAYEESESPEFTAMGYSGSGKGVERDWLSESDYNRIVDIAENLYDYDTGGLPGNGVTEEEKYSVRLDWNINDNHNLALIYNYYDGFEERASDDDSNEFEFANHFYVKGAESETTTVKWAAQWTDSFSTEVFYSNNEMNDSQVTVGNPEFADMQISIGGRSGTVYLGADDSRQANSLSTETDYFKINSELLAGDHIVSFGYERSTLSIFNLFVQHSRGGEYDYFDDSANNPEFCDALTAQERLDSAECGTSGIDKFELGLPSRIYYGSGGGTNDPTDAAASFENVQNTVYVQDEWYISDARLTLVAGLRYEWFETDDEPTFNSVFTEFYGVANTETIDGLDILMPRIGFTWDATDSTTIRGGLGLFSGGNPTVWISNAWSNDGISNAQLPSQSFGESVFDLDLVGEGRPGYDIPQALFDQVAAITAEDGSTSSVVLIDPDYEQPGEWKVSLGLTQEFESSWTLDFDMMYSRLENAAYYQDISQVIVGTTTTGAPIYDYATDSEDVYMLTNSRHDAEGFVTSLSLNKAFDNGVSVTFGYAFTRSDEIAAMNASTAGSNFANTALIDVNDPRPGTSTYETPHRFSLDINYSAELIDGLTTSITLEAERKQGQAQSFVMGSGDLEGDGFFGRHLLYVPTGADDPNVVFADGFDQDAFFAWANKNGLDSGYVSRNQVNAKWSTLVNLGVRQELPTFFDGTSGSIYLMVYNFGNLLNDSWGTQYDNEFFSVQVVESDVNEDGQYVFTEFNGGDVTDVQEDASRWEAVIGLDFRF